MFIHLLHLIKGPGAKYIFVNMMSIFIFFILYHVLNNEMDNPWYYWLYYSAITQTTVGYSGIEKINTKSNDPHEYIDISILSIKSKMFKLCILLHLFSIIFINGYFISSI